MDTLIDALRLIIARSTNAAEEAIRTIAAANNNSPILQIRYLNVCQRALADPSATWSSEERELLASAIAPEGPAARNFMLRIRLTEAERLALQTAADAENQSMSEYARQKIFG